MKPVQTMAFSHLTQYHPYQASSQSTATGFGFQLRTVNRIKDKTPLYVLTYNMVISKLTS